MESLTIGSENLYLFGTGHKHNFFKDLLSSYPPVVVLHQARVSLLIKVQTKLSIPRHASYSDAKALSC